MRNARLLTAVSTAVALIAGPLVAAAPPAVADVRAVSAGALLSKLAVRAESHSSLYKRVKFGSWIDANGDGEDTRAEVLKAESTTLITTSSAGTVKTGRWLSRYDGRRFTAGSKLDIDHLVPLAEAWSSGAWKWSAVKREAYANDLGYAASLIAVSKHANRSKGDHDPADYLPTNTGYRCAYVRNWVAVKYRWHLAVDHTEQTALKEALNTYCSSTTVAKPARPVLAKLVERQVAGSPLQTPSIPTTTTVVPVQPTVPVPTSTVSVQSAAPPQTAVPIAIPTVMPVPVAAPTSAPTPAPYYSNCDAVNAAGAAPLYSWQSGYRAALDSDGDGVACELEAPVSIPATMPTSSPGASIDTSSGASAICRDGTLSYSRTRSGTCSGHGGVRTWL